MNASAASNAEPAASPRAWRSPCSIALFVGTLILALAGDLAFKYWAFRHVADQPVHLDKSPTDNSPVVLIRNDDGELTPLPRRHPNDPASAIPKHDGIVLIPGVLKLKLMLNIGAVFGIAKGQQSVFAGISLIATVVIIYVFVRSRRRDWLMHLCLALILAGALGNLYDRLMYNGVRDMLYLFPGVELPFGWNWPGGATEIYPWIFNIADAGLVLGVIVLVILTWIHDTREAKKKKAHD